MQLSENRDGKFRSFFDHFKVRKEKRRADGLRPFA
jgi:hypothetical protein